jgi:glucose-6-phosphate isomerase
MGKDYIKVANELYGQILETKALPIGIFSNIEYYQNLQKKAQEIKEKYKKVYIVGMGGSFLGAKTIIEGLNLSKIVDFIFYIEDDILETKLNEITNDSLVICISKSGQTVEVLYILEKLLQRKFKNVIGLTENLNGRLASICNQNGFEILKHEAASGRFSFLTNVGILPSLIADLDLSKFLEGVKSAINLILVENEPNFYKHLHSQLLNKNLNLNILMPYSLRLESFTKWFCQLYAESLNREEFNVMPFPSIGTLDQHSVLEGYLQNPQDKMITFIIKKERNLLYREYLLTKQICLERGLEVRVFEFDKIGAKEIGFLMTYFAIEVIFIARVLGIDPFNQEMVEKRKKLNIL